MVTVRRFDKKYELAADIATGDNSTTINGDVSGDNGLQPGKKVVLMRVSDESIWEYATVSTILYDENTGLTTITFEETFANDFPASDSYLHALCDVNIEVGSMIGDGATTSFDVTSEPTEVRLYNSTSPWGIKLEYADPPGDGQWRYNAGTGQVELGFVPTADDVVVAFAGECYLFGDKYLAKNLISEIEEYLFVEPDVAYDCLYVGFREYVTGPVTSEWLSLGKEISVNTWDWYSYHVVCGVGAGELFRLKIKAVLADDSVDIHNYYNVALYTGYIVEPTD